MFENTKIIVTGATGMLGKSTADLLRTVEGATVYAPSRTELNLEDRLAVRNYFEATKPDYVFHYAARVHGLGGNLRYPLEALSTNTVINDAVLAASSIESVKKVFFAGTVAAYGYPYAAMPLIEENAFTGTPHHGEFGYAMAKRHALSYLELLAEKYRKDFVYGIFTNLYGPHDRFNATSGHVIPSLIMKMYAAIQNRTPFHVWGHPETTRDFLFSMDAARAAISLMKNGSGIVNIASGKETTMGHIVSTLTALSQFDGEIQWDSAKPVGIPRRYCDISRLNEHGFKPVHTIESGLKETLDWYFDNVESGTTIRD